MSDYRFDTVASGDDFRYGSVIYSALTARTIGSVSLDSAVPGTEYVLPIHGTWDASGKTITIGGISVTPTAQDASSITFIVPTPYADGSAFYPLNLDVAYDIIVDDSGDPVTKAAGFRIDKPAQPTFWYISSVTGSPWDQTSVFDDATGLANGDSAIAEVLRGALSSFNTNGTFTAPHPVSFRVKAYNIDGWGAEWDTFSISDTEGPIKVSAGVSEDELTIVFDEPSWLGSNSANMNLTFSATNGNGTCTYVSGDGTATWVFSTSRVIGADETISISYVGSNNTIEGATGDDVLSFTSTVTNNSTSIFPSFVGPNIANARRAVSVEYTVDYSSRFLNCTEYSLTGSLPTGLNFNTSTCVITGTPTVIETATGLVITGSDGVNTIDSNAFNIEIAELSGPGRPVDVNSWIQYAAYGTEGVGAVNQAWLEFLATNGFTEGSLNDRMFAYLRGEGYTGALSDMLSKFKIDNEIY